MKKISSVEHLEKKGIPFEIVTFPEDTVKGTRAVAEALGAPLKLVIKTLVYKGRSGKFYILLVGGTSKMHAASMKKRLEEEDLLMASAEEIAEQTGFYVGKIPPFGLQRELPVFIDDTIKEEKQLYVGSGVAGKDIVLTPHDLRQATKGTFVKMVKEASQKSVDLPKHKVRTPPSRESQEYVSIAQALKRGTGEVLLRGWVYRERKSKRHAFIVLRDGSDIMQCLVDKELVSGQVWDDAQKLSIESSVEVRGYVKKDERAPTGFELHVKDLFIIHVAERFPITKDQSTEFLLDQRHLWLRSRKMVAVMKVRATVLDAFREHYEKKSFIEYSPPLFQPTQSEGGSTLFPVQYDEDSTVYLTQSAQLYSEAMIFALEKVFCIAPTFRAEKSKTSRHLSEFWMAEMEAAWMDFDGLCEDVEQLLSHIVKRVLEKHQGELEILERDLSKLECIKAPFPKIKYTEALKLLKEKHGLDIPFGKDLRTVEEEHLSKMFDRPLIITHYPKEVMAFYKPSDKERPEEALCLDVIGPEGYGEIIGGSQRDLDVGKMSKLLKKDGEDPSQYDWYFDLRRFGSVPHSGHGMGVERVVRWICGLEHVRDAIPFPRTIKRITP